MRLILLGLLWACGAATPCHAAEPLRVLVVAGEANPIYQRFVEVFKRDLPTGILVTLIDRVEDFSEGSHNADLILTVGIKAAGWVAGRTKIPVLAVMIPKYGVAELFAARPRGTQTSAIFLDQPWFRQVALVRAALPERTRVGVLYSSNAGLDLGELRNQLAKHGATLIEKQHISAEPLFDDLDELLSRCDVLIAVPEGGIFNSANIRNILLSSYNRGIPLVGFSEGLVKAGALLAVFSTPEQIALQARTATATYARLRRLPEPLTPAFFSVAANREVARSLRITLKPPEVLQALTESAKPQELTR